MIYQEIIPCPALRPFVRNFLLVHLHDVVFPVKPYPTRIEQALVFFARGHIESKDPLSGRSEKIAPNALFGQHVSRLNFRTFSNPDFLMLMVIFQPGALHRMLGISSNELTQKFCDAEFAVSTELKSVNDQIANSATYPEMIECVQQYLLRKLKNFKFDTHPIDRIGKLLFYHPSPFSLDWLAGQASLSPRQFERKFNERIGIGPKLYSRISRFYQAFDYKEKHLGIDWLTIAVHFGYTDYNHLAKDFKQFANVTPNIILKEYAERPEIIVSI